MINIITTLNIIKSKIHHSHVGKSSDNITLSSHYLKQGKIADITEENKFEIIYPKQISFRNCRNVQVNERDVTAQCE